MGDVVKLRSAEMTTLAEIVEEAGLSKYQAHIVREGLRWAERFGLLQVSPAWSRREFDLTDTKVALVVSTIVEVAKGYSAGDA